MVIDCITYAGEEDLLEIRLNILDEFVDEFIIVEAQSTFSGLPKPLYYEQQKERFKKWEHKIKYHITNENYTKEEEKDAYQSKYTEGLERWVREYLQKEEIKKAITHLKDDDIVYLGDVDEIWQPRPPNGIEKLKLRVYTYYLNMTSTEEFWGTIRCQYKDIKDKCFNEVRNNIEYRTEDYQGWHFTNMGGREAFKKKLVDQYNEQAFNSVAIRKMADYRFGVTDLLGRDYDLEVDESNLPEYILLNKAKYAKLLK